MAADSEWHMGMAYMGFVHNMDMGLALMSLAHVLVEGKHKCRHGDTRDTNMPMHNLHEHA